MKCLLSNRLVFVVREGLQLGAVPRKELFPAALGCLLEALEERHQILLWIQADGFGREDDRIQGRTCPGAVFRLEEEKVFSPHGRGTDPKGFYIKCEISYLLLKEW